MYLAICNVQQVSSYSFSNLFITYLVVWFNPLFPRNSIGSPLGYIQIWKGLKPNSRLETLLGIICTIQTHFFLLVNCSFLKLMMSSEYKIFSELFYPCVRYSVNNFYLFYIKVNSYFYLYFNFPVNNANSTANKQQNNRIIFSPVKTATTAAHRSFD